MASLQVNDTFNSYKELRDALDRYENENRVKFWKRDVKTIKSAKNHAPQIYNQTQSHPDLLYYHIKFACIHGGQAFRPKISKAATRRRSHGTWKQNCKAEILVGLTKDRTQLIINRIIDDHNHEIPSVEVFKQLPKQRRNYEDKSKIQKSKKKLMKVHRLKEIKVNKKWVEASLMEDNGNVVILKNLLKLNSSCVSHHLEQISKLLIENYSCTVDTKIDTTNEINAIFFQDCQMKTYFHHFPEIFFIDGTYQLQKMRCNIYLFFVENSLGIMTTVGVGILTRPDKASIEWLITTFKEKNPKWGFTDVIISDKSLSDDGIITQQFPHATKLIDLSHCLNIFKKDILKFELVPTEIKNSLHYFNRLADSSSEESYYRILEEMEDEVPASVMQYFLNNWHWIRSKWFRGFTEKTKHFTKYTKSKFENQNSRMKWTISQCKSFREFVEKLFVLLNEKREEFTNDSNKLVFKRPHNCLNDNFHDYLTPFGYKLIEKSLETPKFYCFKKIDSQIICETKKKRLVLTESSCSCNFFQIMKLPCKHVLSYRKSLNLDSFDKNLFSQRWSKQFLQIFLDVAPSCGHTVIKEETSEEKLEKAQNICSTLAKLCSEAPTNENFQERLDLLIKIKQFWENNDEVMVVVDPVEPKLEKMDSDSESNKLNVDDYCNYAINSVF